MFFRHGFRQGQALVGRNRFEIVARPEKRESVVANLRTLFGFGVISGLLMLGTLPAPALAQSDDEAAPIKIGESNLIPSVRFEYLQTNNAFLTDTDQPDSEQIEATAFVIKPRADWTADRRLLRLIGIYEGEYASYSEEALNYADHSLRAIVNANLSTKQRILARIGVNFRHQPLGTSFTRGISDPDEEQVEFIDTQLSGSYNYGAQSARGNFTLGLNFVARSYQNQEDLTEGADYTSVRPYGQFSLRLSADTRAIATLRFSSTAFENSARDRNDISLLTGLRFAATGKSGGEFQLGASLSNFSAATVDDETSFIAEAELFYEPSVFSRFELSASRQLDNDAGSPLDLSTVLTITDVAKLNWRHEWSSRLFHVADLSYQLENGDCPDRSSLATAAGGIELNLVVRRWLHVGASFNGRARETTLCANVAENVGDVSYESRIVGAHIRATL